MIFAIDFDLTFTACPGLWADFITMAAHEDNTFFLVTCRRETQENTDDINELLNYWGCPLPIIFTNMASKLWATENLGIKVDIWIDDDPGSIINGK